MKSEIVTLGEEVDASVLKGVHVDPKDWNAIISDPEVVVIDTRNQYEIKIGTFEGAINPNTVSFRDFPQFINSNLNKDKHKKVAMFCTGGIRCEKASSFMLQEGFDTVYQLKGNLQTYILNTQKYICPYIDICIHSCRVSII